MPAPERKRGPYYLWVDSSHRLAACRSIKLEQLDGCKFLIPSSIRYQNLESLALIGGDISGGVCILHVLAGIFRGMHPQHPP